MGKLSEKTAIILMHCPDQKGLVAAVTDYLFQYQANIVDLDQHVDRSSQQFFMRVEWELDGFKLDRDAIATDFSSNIAEKYQMKWQLHFGDVPLRIAVFVSKMSHCLYDLVQRYKSKEWNVDIPIIISNHENLRPIAERFDIPFKVIAISKENKHKQEEKTLAILDREKIDLVVLARYMQILSPKFVNAYVHRIINIHHSFLPAFIGARPYHQAFERGVKVIGATSHYVTTELDAGPIIAQDVEHITHKDSVQDLVRKGKDLEKLVLAKAVWNHQRHNILPYKNRTVIF
ncbi:MAG: formyltetrahydrofolate deformylase [Saprospiraceae bacterium]|nr:formyltetrahydrofolate deformylase [Saprospiraceae bacterium]